VENIRGYCLVNVHIRKVFPKRVVDSSSHIVVHALPVEGTKRALRLLIGIQYNRSCPMTYSGSSRFSFLKIFGLLAALWAGAVFSAGNQTLLRIVGNIAAEKGMDLSYFSFAVLYFDSFSSRLLQGLKNNFHGFMEKALNLRSMFKFSHLGSVEFLHRKVANKNTRMTGGFSSNSFGEIADSEVDRIG